MAVHTLKSLQCDLSAMGLRGDETILVHSSMKRIGEVENRADGVLDALSAFFAKGLLVFPALTSVYVDHQLIHFEVKSTPTFTGILPELFRQRANVLRSLHPTHSLAALGRDAAAFVAGHEKYDTAFNRQGPFGRLYARGGKVLLIGVTLNCATCIHALEEWAHVPILSSEPLLIPSTGYDGKTLPIKVFWHTGAHSETFDRAFGILKNANALQTGRFGDAPTILLDCQKTEAVLLPLLTQHPDFFKPEA